jgi:lactate dehydrogenase-like 2-hydroxyacid dehydrogenase
MTKRGPLGAPVLINAGRGGLQNEADILAALDEGLLSAVTLDVFQQEPLDRRKARSGPSQGHNHAACGGGFDAVLADQHRWWNRSMPSSAANR